MECVHCRGKMVRKKVPFQVDREGYHLTFESVPAWVCTQCGEPYFEAAEVDAIQEALRLMDERAEKIAIAQ